MELAWTLGLAIIFTSPARALGAATIINPMLMNQRLTFDFLGISIPP
jgi:hypothetical protein